MQIKEEQNKEFKLLKPKMDVVFQSLFNQEHEDITKSFVEALLEEKINSIVINDSKELIREKPEEKLGLLDLELDINNKEKVDVEIQLIKNDEVIPRSLFYWARLYTKQIHKGDPYTKVKKVVIIAIVDFEINITKELNKMETVWNFREKEKSEKVLTDLFEIRIISLKRAREAYQKDKNSKKNQWVMFLEDSNSKEVKEIMENNEDVKKAVVTVRKMTEDEKLEKIAELREKAIKDEKAIYNTGIREGKELGREEGERRNKIEVIKRMLKDNIDIALIKKYADATDEEIDEAKANK
ncbi:MAG: Rpn family recombination-promoting nuclease/putative transposase [Clostridia bacterium]